MDLTHILSTQKQIILGCLFKKKYLDIASKSNTAKSKHSINTGWMDRHTDAWKRGCVDGYMDQQEKAQNALITKHIFSNLAGGLILQE